MTCPTCNGTRKMTLFTSVEDCPDCTPQARNFIGVEYAPIYAASDHVKEMEFEVHRKIELFNIPDCVTELKKITQITYPGPALKTIFSGKANINSEAEMVTLRRWQIQGYVARERNVVPVCDDEGNYLHHKFHIELSPIKGD